MGSQCISTSEQQPIRPVVYGLCFYFLIAATDSFQIGSFGSFLKIAAFLPLILLLFDVPSLKIRFTPLLIVQLLFWLLVFLSFFYSVDVTRTLETGKTLTLNLLLIICTGSLLEYHDRELQLLKKGLLLGGWMTVLLMFVFSDVSASGRLTLLLGTETQDQNYINGYFLYAFSYHCSQMLLAKKKIHVIPTIFFFAVALLTGSRGSLVAFIAVLFTCICILFAGAEHRFRNILITVLVIALFFVAFDLILDLMPEQVARRFSWDYIAEKRTTGRSRIWRFLLRHYSTDSIPRMLFGHGYGTTPAVNTLNSMVAHNLYLDNLITLGMIGLLLQLILQGSVLIILLRLKAYPLFCAYLGMMFMCLSLSLTAFKPMWNILLLTFALDNHSQSAVPSCSNNTQEVHP